MNKKDFLPLYSRDSSGRIKVWRIHVEDGAVVKIVVYSGLYGGAMTPHITEVTEGKNVGRANETSPYQQAIKDAESKWNKQKRTGYKSLIDLNIKDDMLDDATLKYVLNANLPEFNTDKDDNIIPMKAQPFWKDDNNTVPRIKFPCFGQPKINGVRCFAAFENGRVILRSKKGLEYPLMTHIAKDLLTIYNQDEPEIASKIIFDGELYIHNMILSEIVSAVRKPNIFTPNVKLYIFDIAIPGLTQKARIEMLTELAGKALLLDSIHVVDTSEVQSLHEALDLHKEFRAAGYEGSIFRDKTAEYRFGQRPQTMVKLKDKQSQEFKIVDVIHSPKAPGLAIFVCKNDLNDETFKVNPEGTVEKKKEYYNKRNELLGKKLTVEFYERTDAPKEVPFHAVGISIRDYE